MASSRHLASIAPIALLLLAGNALAAEQLYRLDAVHCQILFAVSHNGYSSPVGRVPVARGWLRADPANLATGAIELEIDTAGLDMGNPDWSKAVGSPRLLDTSRYRYAHFSSSSVEMTGDRQGYVHGELKLNGRRTPVEIAFTFNRAGTTIYGLDKRIGFSARARLDRRDFGITAYPRSIGHQVDVRMEIEGTADPHAIIKYQAANDTNGEDHDKARHLEP